MKKLLSTLIFAAFAALAISPAQAEDDHANPVLEGYLAVTDALYKDDLKAAQKAASSIVKLDNENVLVQPAAKLTEAEDIAGAREAFKSLSASAIEMAKKHGGGKYTVMNCPMVKGGKGDWLSADGKVNNPYFGARMPHCGGPKK